MVYILQPHKNTEGIIAKGNSVKKSAVIRQALKLFTMAYRKFSTRTTTQANHKSEGHEYQRSKMLLSIQWLTNTGYREALIPAAIWMEGDAVLVLLTKRRAQLRLCLFFR